MPVVISPLAEADLKDAVTWYNSRRATLGNEFLASIS